MVPARERRDAMSSGRNVFLQDPSKPWPCGRLRRPCQRNDSSLRLMQRARKCTYYSHNEPAIPPTSAASERIFSLLEAMFGKDQDSALADLIQGALMLRYNKRIVG